MANHLHLFQHKGLKCYVIGESTGRPHTGNIPFTAETWQGYSTKGTTSQILGYLGDLKGQDFTRGEEEESKKEPKKEPKKASIAQILKNFAAGLKGL